MQRLIDRDFLSALVLLGFGAVFWWDSGTDVKDWIFPLLACYAALGFGAVLLARVVLAAARNHAPDLIDGFGENRVVIVDLLVFCAIVLGFILVMHGIGFWLAAFLMLTLASLYLTMERTRRNLVLAVVVPLASCIVAYLVFMRVFYVPVPEATWWSGIG